MSLLKYFKRSSPLPSPSGLLSLEIPLTAISAANDEVLKVLQAQRTTDKIGKEVKQRGSY